MPTESSPSAPTPPILIGRTDELTRLQDIADQAVEQGAQMVLLSGEAGIGKSTLTIGFLAQLREAGWGAHVGHCIEYADRPLPFGPVVNILRSVLLDNLGDIEHLVGHRRDDLGGLLPELREGSEAAASLVGDVDRLFDAISTTFIEASRRRPLVVVIEDIHWADAATRDLVASLVHTLGRARILLIVTERAGAVGRGHPLRTWLAEQRRFPAVQSIELGGLTRGELTEQAHVILGHKPEARLIDELVERTGGNAYFAHELLVARREGSRELPTSLLAFLTSRLERLAEEEREVLRAAAVAGGGVTHRMLSAMLPELNLGPIVRKLFDASILLLEGSEYVFSHALLREAILQDVLPFEAEELHRHAAEAILSDPERGESPSDLASLALHWAHANDPTRSLVAAVVAAKAAADVAAYDTAADLTLQALDAWPAASSPEEATGLERDQLVLQAAEWLASCYRGTEAVTLISDALDGWAADLATGRRALLMARMGPIEYSLGNPTRASELLVEAERLVGNEVSSEAAQVHHKVSKKAIADGQIHPALEAAERAIAVAESQGPPVVLVEALASKALAVGVTEDLEAGIGLAREARALALAGGFVSQVAQTYRTEMLIFLFRDGRTAPSLQALTDGLEYAEEHCGPRWRAEFRHDLSLGYVEAGRLNDAKPLLTQLMASELDAMFSLWVLQTSALHAMGVGDLELASTYLADANEIANRYQSAQETGVQARLLAELARRQGRLDEAVDLIDRAITLQLANDNLTYTRESIVEKVRIARTCADVGHGDKNRLLAEVAALVQDFNGEGNANVAMRSLMDLELAAATATIGLEEAARTIELLEAAGFSYEAAQARLLVVERLMTGSAKDRPRLEREIQDLLEVASSHGMDWIAERALLLARGARVAVDNTVDVRSEPAKTEEVRSLPHHLTAREVEVMSLLAEGLSNKGIGERLYVSPRTVSTHVSNLLAKLGVGSRGEAAAAYHRLGLDEVIDLRDPIAVD